MPALARRPFLLLAALVGTTLAPVTASAQSTLPAAMQAAIDSGAGAVLANTGAPSASIAVVRGGKIVYAKAYGMARIDRATPATPAMRYSIGSNSKQFTATAVLLLAEQHKLSLDDKVSRWLPQLTRANDVTLRQVLSMTSGYQDFWPQDYVMPPMLQATTAEQIINSWAKKPLDFEPGTKWQYSNTNFVIAGMIVERVAGMPLVDFLQRNIFTPLRMSSVFISDSSALPSSDPERYMRYARGPVRVAPKEGRGWMFAAGELAMTPSDLARWDISVIDQKILKPASYRAQQTEVLLTNGVGTGYGLGVDVGTVNGHRAVYHTGEVSGFTSENLIFPDDSVAVVVLTNLDAADAYRQIANRITAILFGGTDVAADKAVAQARTIFAGLQRGTIDRSLFTSNANAYFSDQALADFKSSLAPYGKPKSFTQTNQYLRGGMTFRSFAIELGTKRLTLTTFTMPDGKLEQYIVSSE
ncbi:MAG TPA: serine hydrolase domain-containing protein [Gemmatimonadaceae bacterium]|jgi:CubicO group peptidase (beta-lactamase class C family)